MRQKATRFNHFIWMPFLIILHLLLPIIGYSQIDSTKTNQPVHQLRNTVLNHQNHFPLLLPIGFLVQSPLEFSKNRNFTFSFQQNYSAIHFFKNSLEREIGLDMEYLHYQFNIGYMHNSDWSFQLTYGLNWHWDGFFDPFLGWYHEKFNLPNYGREKRDENDYFYLVSGLNGAEEIALQQRKWHSNDPVLSVYHHLLSNETMRFSLGLNVQFPLFKISEGINNRALNFGISGFFTYIKGDFDFYQSLSFLIPGDSSHFLWKEANPGIGATTSLTYRLAKRGILLSQLSYGQSPFRNTEGNRLDDPPIELIVGYSYNGKHGRYTFSFSEDILIPGPDFTLSLTYEMPIN
jgi:hypothetical protein